MKIKRFRGIPIHKVLSDNDFVERAQKNLKRSKKYAWIHAVILIFACVLVTKLFQVLWGLIEDTTDQERQAVWAGLMVGILFGVIIGHFINIAGQSILTAIDLFDFNRGNKLLIKYHDMLKENGLLENEDKEEESNGQMFEIGEIDRPPFC